jgi:formylglycine-generating enzyme required for sulfatase activity
VNTGPGRPPSPPGGAVAINELGDRAAMGLPGHFVARSGPDEGRRHRDLLRCEPGELIEVLESTEDPLGRRVTAGRILALIGDPRIDVAAPVMVDVPGTEFLMGLPVADLPRVLERWSPVGVLEDWIRKECPEHPVRTRPVAVMKYLVTNIEYRAFLEQTGWAGLPTSWRFGIYPQELANHPVWTVSPASAQQYAGWLSARTGRSFRLLSEPEWELAAGGGQGREFPWGEEFEAGRANTADFGPLTTTPVGCFAAGLGPYPIHDLSGNVEEWVGDDYAPYPGGDVVADDLLAGGSYRVARGGSFTRFGDLARCRRRHGWYQRDIYAIGFRLAEEISPRHPDRGGP